VELVIHLTKDGPVARIAGSSLELVTPGKLGIHCAELEIRAARRMTMEAGGAVLLKADGEIRMRSAEQTFIDGDYVNINCLDRAGYHDAEPPEDDGRNG
jgi:hypothetical protein